MDPKSASQAGAAAEQSLLEQAESLRKKGALTEAMGLAEAALAGAESRGDPRMQALAQLTLANCHRYVPNSLTAIQLLNRAEQYLRAAADPLLAKALTFKDIDLFKRINDTWSHAMGDAVLQGVGAILRDGCRDQDLVARIGGEEFVLVMQGVSPAQAAEACERIRGTIARHPWHALQPEMAVTLSIGLAVGDGSTALDELLKVADQRLYAAKRGGRNRVVDA